MNRKIKMLLACALLHSVNMVISMDQPTEKPLHRYEDKVLLENNSSYDIAFKFANADEVANIGILPAGKVYLCDFTPKKFSIKRSGYGDQYVSYKNYNLLQLVIDFVTNIPKETELMKYSGYIPKIVIESNYTEWKVYVKWFRPEAQ